MEKKQGSDPEPFVVAHGFCLLVIIDLAFKGCVLSLVAADASTIYIICVHDTS